MSGRVVFDVYGRFRVAAEPTDTGWRLWMLGGDGTRRPLHDVPLEPDATLAEVEQALEAAFHELARPGATIDRVER